MVALLDDHYFAGVTMSPAAVQAAIAADVGTRAVMMMMSAALDNDGFSVGSGGHRWHRDRDRADCRQDKCKLLHVRPPPWAEIKHQEKRNVPREPEENSE